VSVLQRKELEDSPLADLHAIASELGIEGYRALRKEDLIASILGVEGGGDSPAVGDDDSGEASEDDRPRRGRRRGGRGRGRRRDEEDAPASEQPDGEIDDEPAASEAAAAEPPAADDEERETVEGVLDVISNGSGFLRVDGGTDVYVSPAQIRRCELRAGDTVAGPVRPARRTERHPSLVRVATINGGDADAAPEQRSSFDSLTPVHPTERLAAPAALDGAPFGKGSRVAIAGPSGSGATRLLREVVSTLAAQPGDLELTVVLAGARPEEVTEWRAATDAPIHGGSFDSTPDEHAQAAQLAVERAKRVVERGGDAVVVVDSLATLPPGIARRVFGAGRKAEQGGSLTIVAAVGESPDALRIASTRAVLEPGATEPKLDAGRSGAQRSDLLS
jgi:transcription termination factor Rho